jgi:2-oxoglutarate ferredoxin oxidoreductase subunit alpha
MGQAMEPVIERYRTPERPATDWTVTGADGRPPRVVKSLHLRADDLEAHNRHLQAKYRTIAEREVRWAGERLEDADLIVVAYGTAARVARTAIGRVREAGIRAGLLRPVTLWPFPAGELAALADTARGFLVVELSAGQMVEDVRLAVEGRRPVLFEGRMGGMVPTPGEVVDAIGRLAALATGGER